MALTRITKGVIKPNENYDTHNINSTGIVTAVGANFSGNVSVGGVLTYEDVTNIDSVGIITARQGIFIDDSITHIGDTDTKIRFPAANQISFETTGTQRMIIGSSGNITLNNEFRIPDSIAHVGDNDTKVRFPAADTVTIETAGSERLRITDVGRVYIGGQSGRSPASLTPQLQIEGIDVGTSSMSLTRNSANSGAPSFIFNKTRGTAVNADTAVKGGDTLGIIQFVGNDGGDSDNAAAWVAAKVDDATSQTMTSNEMPGRLEFYTRSDTSSGSLQERLRIDSSGRVLIGTTTEGYVSADDLTVATTGSTGITIRSGTGSLGTIAYSDGTSGDAEYRGYLQYAHDVDALKIGTAGAEKLRINNTGRVLIGHTAPSGDLHGPQTTTGRSPFIQQHGANASSAGAALISWSASSGAYYSPVLYLGRSGSATKGTNGAISQGHTFGSIVFSGDDGTDFVKGAMITAESDGTPGNNDMPGRLEFHTTPDGAQVPVERLRIDRIGRVMIGTTSADSVGSVDQNVVIGSTTNAEEVALTLNVMEGTNNRRIKLFLDDDDGVFGLDSTASTGVPDFVVRMATSEKFRITQSGKVLLNSASARTYVDGAGNTQTPILQIEDNTNSNTAIALRYNSGAGAANRRASFIFARTADGSAVADSSVLGEVLFMGEGNNTLEKAASIRAEVDGTPGTNDMPGRLIFSTSADGSDSPTERLRIASNGHVGINTNDPQSKLDLRGDLNINNNTIISNFDSNGIGGSNIDHFYHIDAPNYGTGGTWHFVSDSTYKATGNSTLQAGFVNSSGGGNFLGNVGIGLTSPSTALHVQNSSSVVRVESTSTSTSARVEITGASNSYSGLHFGDTSDVDNGFIRYYNADNYMILGTNTLERIRIYDDGRVNIGGSNEVQLQANNEAILYLHGAVVGANLDGMFGLRSIMDDDDTGTTTADRERGSAYFAFNGNASGGDTNHETRLWNIWSDVNATADYDNCYGFYGDVRTTHTSGTISHMRGVYGIVQTASSGSITEMVGLYGIAQPTTGSSGTVADVVGGKFRANMAAGSSTARATDLFGVWSQIDNDNDVNQANSGTRTALFYGNYDKTTGLTNPQGIRIDTDVPNYFRGGIAINGGSSFTPTGNHALHIRNSTNATGIFLEQTGDQYNVIRGDANRSGADNAIIDIQGYWNTTQVGRIRIDTGADTTNKDDGRLQFFTASSGTLTERMRIQENGEIAMRSSGTPSDALANLHVQNETFRVSNDGDGANTTYIQLTAHNDSTDGDRNIFRHVKGSVIKSQITNAGHIMSHLPHYAGRTRTDVNAPANVYSNGSNGFFAYSGTTNNTANYRGTCFIRSWDGGDGGDRNIIYFTDSGSDTTANDYDQHQYFGVKANGMVQTGSHVFVGRIESDEGSPNSVYRGVTGTAVIVYPNSSSQYTRIDARTTDNTDRVYGADTGGGVVIKFESQGNGRFDGGADVGNASDYAEYFEWLDGNTSNADRRGITVVLDGEKIRPATDSDDTSKIIGVVSANPAVVGDSAWSEWQLAHQKDAYGSWVTEDKEYLVWNKFGTFTDTDGVKKPNPQPDINDYNRDADYQILVSEIEAEKAKGNVPQAAIDQNLRVTKPSRTYNPDYDKTRNYVPRSHRKEWSAIGLVGKLVVRRGQPVGANWILMKSNVGTDPNDSSIILDKYLVR